jgi:ribosomal protein S18 acetylase RimI-like enzyme
VSGRRFTVSLEVAIRPARAEDLPALEWMGLFSAHREIIRAAFEAQERGDALLLLAIAGGFPVAQVWIDFARRRERRIATIWAVRTFFPLQGRGIGRQMMLAAEEAIRARGIHRAELEVEHGNDHARRFYGRLGWRAASEQSAPLEVSDGGAGPRSVAMELQTLEKDL